jgi:Protein of unknown function (DUF3379)
MTHDEARELIGAVPNEASPELLQHLHSCPECQAYRDEMVAFDAKLRRALELDWQKIQGGSRPAGPVPKPPSAQPASTHPGANPAGESASELSAPASATVVPINRSRRERAPVAKHTRPRLFAFAASVAAALVIGGVLWLSRPPESLAAEIVTHVEGEPGSWQKTEPLAADKLDAVLRKSGVNLGPGMAPVVYASSCWFRGHFVPHVVVTTKDGPVTVMILQHEKVNAPQQFNEDGFSGLLVPARTGSVAVLSRTPMNLEKPAAEVVHSLAAANQP